MLKVSKVNDRGLVEIFYTHEQYLSKDTQNQIVAAKRKYQKINNTLFFASSLFTYWVTLLFILGNKQHSCCHTFCQVEYQV